MKGKFSFHYGWVVCLCATFIFFINVGFTNSAFGVHLPYIINSLGCTNAEASLIVSVRTAATMLALCLADIYIKKFGIKRGLEYALFVGVLGFLSFAFAAGLPVYYFGGFCIGLASGFGGFMVLSMLLHQWFKDSLGLALGVCAAGSGFAVIILPPLLTKLINSIGLNKVFIFEALMEALALLLSVLLVFSSPQEKALKPYENGKQNLENVDKRSSGIDISSGIFLIALMSAAMAFTGAGGHTGTFFTLLYTGLGYSETAAAAMYSAVGCILTAAKLVFGRLSDAIGAYKTALIAYAIFTAGCVFCCFAGKQSALINILAIAFQGVGLVVTTITITAMAEDLSTDESFPRLLKIMNIFYFLGILVGSYILGLLADITGNYVVSFALCGFFSFASAALVIIIYKIGKRKKAA